MAAAVAVAFFVVPTGAHAGFFSAVADMLTIEAASGLAAQSGQTKNSQTMTLLKSVPTPNAALTGRGGGDVTIVDGSALAAESGPLGSAANLSETSISHQISVYTVRKGDSVGTIAKMFGVSGNTILWANNLTSKTALQEGQSLVILPISGVLHIVKSGDTVESIAKKYKADVRDILLYNELSENAKLAVGMSVTIPDGEIVVPVVPKKSTTAKLHDANGPEYRDFYMRPVAGIRTQGLHGYNGIDIGAPTGTPVYASAAGDVIIATAGGWNGGYGSYVVISHVNGTQTLYGHLSKVSVFAGQRVAKGQQIGAVGNTGKSTGPHLHFEIRGAKNPF